MDDLNKGPKKTFSLSLSARLIEAVDNEIAKAEYPSNRSTVVERLLIQFVKKSRHERLPDGDNSQEENAA